MSWQNEVRCSSHLQYYIASFSHPLTSPTHLFSHFLTSPLFSNRRCTAPSKFLNTQIHSVFTEELVLPRHVQCVLSRFRCNEHSLRLTSHLSRTGRIENSLCSACSHPNQDTSHLILYCPPAYSLCCASLETPFLFTTSASGQKCPVSGMSSTMPLFLEKDQETTRMQFKTTT